MFEKFGHDFYINFIKDDRYTWLLDGLKNTMIITVFALLIGICIGFLVAIIRSSHDKSGNFKIANSICRVYLTVIRGTPTVIQLLIMNFVVFGSVSVNEILVGSLAFGINSGAYVAEIVRSRDRQRQDEALDLILPRPCVLLSFHRRLRMCFLHW
mgnify:CR=1 FL=1